MIGREDLRIDRVVRNEVEIARLIDAEREFWRCVELDQAPPAREVGITRLARCASSRLLKAGQRDFQKRHQWRCVEARRSMGCPSSGRRSSVS